MKKAVKNPEAEIQSRRIHSKRMRIFLDNFHLFLLALPGIVFLVIFQYLPMFGLVMGFKDYVPRKGLFGSEWVGLDNFKFFFTSQDAWRTIRNTVLYAFDFLIVDLIVGVVVALLLYLIRDDLPYIQQLETRLTDLEQAVLDNDTGRFLHRMSVIRKELNRTNRYYAQLCDFASTLLEDAEEQLSGHSKKRLNHFLRKVENLRGETRMLHEYATQISSEYQAQVDIDQNRVMKVLTIVTAIFLPLTLIAGWYGMNFPNILLLGWRYGYAAVAIVSALVVVLLIWYFKRKKWF